MCFLVFKLGLSLLAFFSFYFRHVEKITMIATNIICVYAGPNKGQKRQQLPLLGARMLAPKFDFLKLLCIDRNNQK